MQQENDNAAPPYYIVGLGSQAMAWAQNLRESEQKFSILARKNGDSYQRAQSYIFNTQSLEDFQSEVPCWIFLLTPDDTHLDILRQLSPRLSRGSSILYAHGQSFVSEHLAQEFPQFHHLLLAPKAIAHEVRQRFVHKMPLGAAYDIVLSQDQNSSQETYSAIEKQLMNLASAIGINLGPYRTSFHDEMVADLFSEQTLLCSSIPYLARMSFEKLCKQGLSKELAYMECWFELKLITDTLCKIGPERFFEMISPTALAGGLKAKEKLFDQAFEEKFDQLLENIQSGAFNKELKETDISQLRQEVLADWKQSPLTSFHQQEGKKFFKGQK